MDGDALLDVVGRIGVVAAVVVAGFYLGQWIEPALSRAFSRGGTRFRGKVEAQLLVWILYAVAISLALAWAIPEFEFSELVTGFGFISVAVGFAFRDVLENTLSGLLLLYRQPFEIGDQVEFEDMEGTVEGINVRTTQIRTYDGQLIHVPNRTLYQGNITVQTDREKRRIEVVVGVAYSENLPDATTAMLEAVASVPEVRDVPPPEAFALEFGTSTINIQVRCWGPAPQGEFLRATDLVVKAVKGRLDEVGIEMPAHLVALQGTDSFRAALHDRGVTPGGALDPLDSNGATGQR